MGDLLARQGFDERDNTRGMHPIQVERTRAHALPSHCRRAAEQSTVVGGHNTDGNKMRACGERGGFQDCRVGNGDPARCETCRRIATRTNNQSVDKTHANVIRHKPTTTPSHPTLHTALTLTLLISTVRSCAWKMWLIVTRSPKDRPLGVRPSGLPRARWLGCGSSRDDPAFCG
jgi:hypothetical protein